MGLRSCSACDPLEWAHRTSDVSGFNRYLLYMAGGLSCMLWTPVLLSVAARCAGSFPTRLMLWSTADEHAENARQ